jgi:DNA-binding transcriptional ArsR family regulator
MAAARRATDATRTAIGAPDGEAPERERLISDVETLKALSDPLRLRILETMVSRSDGTWSVKELASELAVPQTRLYHHVDLLLERDLIRVAAQRVVSGIIESRYRVSALSFRLDRGLLASNPSLREAGGELLATVFDSAREEVARALETYLSTHPDAATDETTGGAPDRPVLTRGLAMLPPARAAEFRDRLLALMGEYDTETSDPDAVPFGFLFALYRVPSPQETSDD